MSLKYTITNSVITVFHNGQIHTVSEGSPNFKPLKNALFNEKWDEVPTYLSITATMNKWAKGYFTLKDSTFYFKDVALPELFNKRIVKMATEGEDPTPLFKFWERLQKNPSFRSVEQLWPFLDQQGIPLTEDGCFLAYKAVREDLKDIHSGTIDNTPGKIVEIERNRISDDPNHACHFGLHVGALEYARNFGGYNSIVLICKVDPADVVCVPYDHSFQKMRVCRYEVMGHHTDNDVFLPSTVVSDEDLFEAEDIDVAKMADGQEIWDIKPTPISRVLCLATNPDHPYDSYNMSKLLDLTIDQLRTYAANHLKIVGASKIPGGKIALVSKIISTLGKSKR